jgi:hypothetical protein
MRAHPIDVYPMHTAGNALACFLQASDSPSSNLLVASARGTTRVFIHATGQQYTAMHDLGESRHAATPRCHLPDCEPSKLEHVGELVGLMKQST